MITAIMIVLASTVSLAPSYDKVEENRIDLLQDLAAVTESAERDGVQVQTVPDPIPDPPWAGAPVGVSACEEMSWYREAVGLPERFDGIGYRESRCLNEEWVKTWCCHGWWQMYTSVHLKDHRLAPMMAECGVSSHHDLNSNTAEEKWAQACAAHALWVVDGTNPWVATR